MKPKIICIVGASGSGKTTLTKHVPASLVPTLVSYTTRPKRENEADGQDHYFVSEEQMPDKSEMLAYTKFGGYHYWTSVSQAKTCRACLYVIDEKGLMNLLENYDDQFDIKTIKIKCSDETLKCRVDESRLQRDRCRVIIEDKGFDKIIYNDGTLEEFINQGINAIKELL